MSSLKFFKSKWFILVTAGVVFITSVIYLSFNFWTRAEIEVLGQTMLPTYQDKQRLCGQKIWSMQDLQRNDVAVIYTGEGSSYYLKRVIALENETIAISDNKVTILNAEGNQINFKDEYGNYFNPDLKDDTFDLANLKIPMGNIYVLGDNRQNSADSRIFGPVPVNQVKYKITRSDTSNSPFFGLSCRFF
ncbi:MAG: hypothetical protein OHK0017_05090 [Patescibacteria group bacterium]